MTQRLLVGLLALAAVMCAQRRVDPRNTYSRAICVVPMTGSGTPADPRRPQYAPWPPSPCGRSAPAGRSSNPREPGCKTAYLNFVDS